MARTVKVPPQYEELFERAEALVSSYFGRKREAAEQGRIEVDGERYILVRAPSLSVEFYDFMESLYHGQTARAHAVARNLLFHLAHSIGRSDARAFHEQLGLSEPLAKLSAGPVHFAHAGWAFVDILPDSEPVASEEFYLAYEHPYSFEAESWRSAGRRAPRPVCFMNAGYSSGWCEESFGVPLVAAEIQCVAKGDPSCRFVMGHASHIEALVSRHLETHPALVPRVTAWEVPGELEHRELELRLRLSEGRYRHLFDASTDAILVVSEGRVDDANRRAAALFGRPRMELRGLALAELATCPQVGGRATAELLAAAVERAAAGAPQELRLRLDDSAGEALETEVSLSRVEDSGAAVLLVIRDVTERERLAGEVRQLQKMESLGTLAGGIAHDFNNLLTSAMGSLALLRGALDRESPARAWLDDAQQSLDRGAASVRRLLTLARVDPELRSVVDVKVVVDETAHLLRDAIDPRIELLVVHEARPTLVVGNPNELSQALVNLALNSRDAILERLGRSGATGWAPRITFRTTHEAAPTGVASERPTVRIAVEDNGLGMDETATRRCLEPFFTTKPVGAGTGLGLTMAYGIVTRHEGRLEVRSEPGAGTRLSILLPATDAPLPTPPPTLAPEALPPGGTETLLLADDEGNVRKLCAFAFERLGYTVVSVSDGAEVLEVLDGAQGPSVDLVLLDLMMPRINGRDVLSRTRRTRPELPVIVSSGYATDLHASDLVAAGARAFLPKPYHIDDLARLVRTVLDGGP